MSFFRLSLLLALSLVFLGSSVVPRRVVVFHPVFLQDALSLGVLPVAGHKTSDLHLMLTPRQRQSIEQLAYPINPEQLAEFHADLFITPKLAPDKLALFEQLAPAEQIGGFSTGYDWRKRHLEVAAALGRVAQAKLALQEYDRRAKLLRSELTAAGLHPKVLMAFVHEDRISVFDQNTNGVRVLTDAGLEHAAAVNPKKSVSISYERLRELDCDALFIVPAPAATDAAADAIRHQIDLLNGQPLWRSLQVVQRGHVYFEDVYWQNTTPLTADMMLADIARLFLGRTSFPLRGPAPTAP